VLFAIHTLRLLETALLKSFEIPSVLISKQKLSSQNSAEVYIKE
jgi:hypothetical protein